MDEITENSPEVCDSLDGFFEGPPTRRGFAGAAAVIVLGPLMLLLLALVRSFFTFPPDELVLGPADTVGPPLVPSLLINR